MAVLVQDLDVYGRGVARLDGQVLFIEGALPNEVVEYQVLKKQKRFAEARVQAVLEAAPERVEPRCPYYARCGGCALQHLDFAAQVRAKERLYQQQLQRIGQMQPQEQLIAIEGVAWRYRSRSRLAVQYVGQAVSVGYFARGSHEVVDVEDCLVLDELLAAAIPSVRELLLSLLPKRVQAVALHRGEDACALQLESAEDLPLKLLQDWQQRQEGKWALWVNKDCVAGDAEALFYDLPDFGLRIGFAPQDFTQVNPVVNRALVAQAMDWVQAVGAKSAMDFFAGLGNFSLPMASLGVQVQAVEGVWEMVTRAKAVAAANGLQDRVLPSREDLFAPSAKAVKAWQENELWLLDPPRAGAAELVSSIKKGGKLQHLVYVSCDSATLARDAKILQEKGFVAKAARVANMFAQTAHIESIVQFERR